MQLRKKIYTSVLIFLIIFCANIDTADAKIRKHIHRYDFTKSPRYASLIVDFETGNVLHQRNANKQLHPASLTKLMTIYLTLQAIDDGKLSFDKKLPVSVKATLQPKTNLRLKPGQTITVRDCLYGLIVHSANDSAVVLAEAISGNESSFAEFMTEVARQLGMHHTNFTNASGLPNPEQITTAYDMAKLAIALRRDFPHYYSMFSKKSFVYKGRIISGHNRVLNRYQWADGLKTGYINAAGFNLITSASKNNSKLIGVVLGGPTATARDNHMISLLEYGYKKLETDKNSMLAKVTYQQNEIPYTKSSFEVAANNITSQAPNFTDVNQSKILEKKKQNSYIIKRRTTNN